MLGTRCVDTDTLRQQFNSRAGIPGIEKCDVDRASDRTATGNAFK